MSQFSLCYFSATSMEIQSLSGGVRRFLDQGGQARILARTQSQLFDQRQIASFVKRAMSSDIVIIGLHGGKQSCPAWDALIQAMEEAEGDNPLLHVQPTGGDEESMALAQEYSSRFESPEWKDICAYLSHGGAMNFCFLMQYLEAFMDKRTPDAPPPEALPQEGIYHPDFPGLPSLKEYKEKNFRPGRLTVGLWFYQSYWVNNNLVYIDSLIRELERRGANVIPVFHQRFKDVVVKNRGSDYIVDEYFMEDGKSIIDVLINPMMFALTMVAKEYKELYPKMNVPVIQAMMTMQPREVWQASCQGMKTMEVSYNAAQPEFDGALITVPIASREEDETDPVTGALISRYKPIEDRSDKVVSLALNWARLSKLQNSEKKVAIVFHHYPPRNDRIGCAAGLDSFESVKLILDRLHNDGYQVDEFFENGQELAERILSCMTCDSRWITYDKMAERCQAFASDKEYAPWHEALPAATREKQTHDWGAIPGELFVHDEKMMFPGFINGNVFVTIQPPRGFLENTEAIYHDMYLSPPHHYLAHYRWIKNVFKADAVMHIGKHGSLEWLPGKALGLSEECYPDSAIMDLPNIYPYIINDPSEGAQAKRRSYCCIIDHLTPVFTNADLYEDMTTVESKLKEYEDAKKEDPGKCPVLIPLIWEAVVEADLDKDLETTEEEALGDFDAFLEKLHSYMHELSDTMIGDGLHIFATPPEGERLVEFLVQLTRLNNGDVPSLRESVCQALGWDMDVLLENRGKSIAQYNGKTGGECIRQAHETALAMVGNFCKAGFDKQQVPSIVQDALGKRDLMLENALDYIGEFLTPNIARTTEEMDYAMTALNGEFVPPGPSGAPTRGQADILPTGRNFYSVDPLTIPTPGAWEVGVRLGDALIERTVEETGKYPENVGIVVYGGPTMRSRGDDIAEILYLYGLKPVWAKGSGRVAGLEVIPQSQLNRPRIDVTPRVSGFFRDSFPNLMEMLDEAAQMAASLDEPEESNLIRKHVVTDMQTYLDSGMDKDEAFREATFRVFGCPPGAYGAGVTELVESKLWDTQDDLGNNYIRYSSHAYGRGTYGAQKPETFRKVLSRMDTTVKNEDSREYDMMSCTDYYNYYGGLIVAAKTVRGEAPLSFMGDSSDPSRVKMRTTQEEAKHILRARLINPKWLDGLKRHGYKGAGDISHMMDVMLGWDATAEVMDDWMYERVANKYALDQDMKDWMKEVNPYALQNILDKLLEAIKRGMWNASDDMEEALMQEYLDIEGEIEELTE